MINMVNLYLDSAERPKIQSSDMTTHIAYAREALRKSCFSAFQLNFCSSKCC